jgi:glycerol uptake facilitator-like aquaporin
MEDKIMVTNLRTSAVAAELVGTFTLALVVLTVSKSSLNLPFFISFSAGLAVAGMVLLFGRISGAQLNPAVTLGLLSVRRISALKAVVYVVAQLVGGLAAYYLFAFFSGQRWHNSGQFEAKLLIAEVLGAFLLSLGWAAVVFQRLESARAAAIIGLSFALALLATSSAGTEMLNPAIALGMRSWLWGSSVLGPLVGAVAGFHTYKYVFARGITSVNEAVPGTSNVQTVGATPHVRKNSR